jgi:hypothetical protein
MVAVQGPDGACPSYIYTYIHGIALYVPKRTILKEMAAKIEFFFDLVWELSK